MSAKKPTMISGKNWNHKCIGPHTVYLVAQVTSSTRLPSRHFDSYHILSWSRYQTEIRPWVIGVGNSSILGKVNIRTKWKQKNSCWMLAARCFFTNTKSSCGCWANNIRFTNKNNPSSDLICHDAMQFDVLKGIDFNAAGYMKICRGLIRQVVWYLQGSKGNFREIFWFYNPWCKFQMMPILYNTRGQHAYCHKEWHHSFVKTKHV